MLCLDVFRAWCVRLRQLHHLTRRAVALLGLSDVVGVSEFLYLHLLHQRSSEYQRLCGECMIMTLTCPSNIHILSHSLSTLHFFICLFLFLFCLLDRSRTALFLLVSCRVK